MNQKPYFLSACCIATAITIYFIQDSRISALRAEIEELKNTPEEVAPQKKMTHTESPSRITERSAALSERLKNEDEETETSAMEDFGKAMRKMAENPAAKEMFKTGHIAAARMIYEPLLEKLNLSKEEEEYFLGVLAGEFADQQQMGMRMMGATTAEERRELAAEMEANKEKRKQEIAEFLNNDEDAAEFEKYQDRLPERQQMSGIKTAIAQTGTPLTEAQENQLIDVMHNLRTGSEEAKKWDGPHAMEMFTRPDVEEVFEKDWAAGQEALKGELVGVLNEEQAAAFFENQAQMKQMHLMGIKMMKGMMKTDD